MAYTSGTIQDTNTLAGLLRINDANLSEVEFNDVIQPSEFFQALPFVTASRGTQHSWTVRTSAPGAAFREISTGISNAAGKERTITEDLKLLDASFHRDIAKKGALGPRMTWEQYLQRETMLSLNASLTAVEKQFILGTDEDADGWQGLSDILDIWGNMGEDVGGTGGTRCYMLCLAPDRIAGIIGGNSAEPTVEVGDPARVLVKTDDGTYDADRVSVLGWMGLQIAGSYSGAVAFNIDGTSTNKLDEDLLATLYTKFPTQHRNAVNAILMSRTGLKQLRDSLVTDLVPSPPFPTAWGGAGREIPIIVSDAVDEDEADNETA